jgi:hypothetical protein
VNGKRGYAVIMKGGNVYQDREGKFEFCYARCIWMTLWPRSACQGGTVHHLPLRGRIQGYIPPFHPESWQ